MTKSWSIIAVFALCACSGHGVSTSASGVGRAELHIAPAFAPVQVTKIDPIDASLSFVRNQGLALGLDAHAAFTALGHEVTADGNDHVRLQQTYDGVKVYGSDIIVHADNGNITGVDGTLLGSLQNLDLLPSLADTTATTIAKSDYLRSARDASAVRTSRESNELIVLPVDGGAAHLAWHVIFATDRTAGPAGIWNYFIDAHDGSIVERFNNLQTVNAEASGPGGNARVTRTWTMNLDVAPVGRQLHHEDDAVRDHQRQDLGGLQRHVADQLQLDRSRRQRRARLRRGHHQDAQGLAGLQLDRQQGARARLQRARRRAAR